MTSNYLGGFLGLSFIVMKSKALSLYRQSLRTIRAIPVPAVRRKMAYNIRELFDIYKEAPSSKVSEVIEDGIHDLSLLSEILKGRKESVYNIFKTFENLNQEASEAEIDSKKQIISL